VRMERIYVSRETHAFSLLFTIPWISCHLDIMADDMEPIHLHVGSDVLSLSYTTVYAEEGDACIFLEISLNRPTKWANHNGMPCPEFSFHYKTCCWQVKHGMASSASNLTQRTNIGTGSRILKSLSPSTGVFRTRMTSLFFRKFCIDQVTIPLILSTLRIDAMNAKWAQIQKKRESL
jgi:hypothetical protein